MARASRNASQPATGPSTQVQRDLDIIGDGNVDLESRAEVRGLLRQRQQEAQTMAENPNMHTLPLLARGMRANDQLFKQVRLATDAAIDAQTTLLNSSTAQKISKMAKNEANAFDLDEIIVPLRKKLGMHLVTDEDVDMDEEDAAAQIRLGRLGDWAAVGWMAAKHSRRVYGVEFMYGPMAIEHKKRVVIRRDRAGHAPRGPAIQPSAVAQEDLKQNENETVKNVRQLEKLLERVCSHHPDAHLDLGIPFFQWFINPDDFGQSVENLFYTSFLVKDSKCSVDVDNETGELHIMACEPPELADYRDGLTKRQVIMELTEEAWKDAIDLYDITESIIPTRAAPAQATLRAGGWY